MLPFDWFDRINRDAFWKDIDQNPPPVPKIPFPPLSDPLDKLDFPGVKSKNYGRWTFFWVGLAITTAVGFVLNFFSTLTYPTLHSWYAIVFHMTGGP